jgi:hypothetical protein
VKKNVSQSRLFTIASLPERPDKSLLAMTLSDYANTKRIRNFQKFPVSEDSIVKFHINKLANAGFFVKGNQMMYHSAEDNETYRLDTVCESPRPGYSTMVYDDVYQTWYLMTTTTSLILLAES